jgi:DNA primase
MVACPFHEDHTPSLKLDQRYYCFGCGATGDVIDFAARLFNVSNSNAAQILAEKFGIQSESQTVIEPKIKPAASLRNLELRCLFALVQYEKLLRFWKKQHAPQAPEVPLHEKFVEGCLRESFIAHLIDEMSDADPWRRKQAVKLLLEDDHLHCLQDYVLQNQEEEMKMNICKRNEESGNGGYCS